MLPTDPPRATGIVRDLATLDGMLIYATDTPFGPRPFFLQIQGGSEALPVFTNLDAALRFQAEHGTLLDMGHRLKSIRDTAEFLSSVPPDLAIVLDVQRTARGTVKYLELKLPSRRWISEGARPPGSDTPGSTVPRS